MEVKQVDRLSDWFDCLIVLSETEPSLEARTFADAFAAHGWAWVGGRSIAPPDAEQRPSAEPVEISGALRGADGVEALHAWLRSRYLKQPLFWVEGAGFETLLEAFSHPFKVALVGEDVPSEHDAKSTLDLTIARLEGTDVDARAAWLERTREAIRAAVQAMLAADKALNVLVLYDDQFTYISTIYEHLATLKQYSRHNLFFLPGSNLHGHYTHLDRWPEAWDLSVFDVIVWHYSIRAARPGHIYAPLAERLARFTGLKVLFIQDEYDDLHVTWSWIRRVGIHLVMTCAPNMTSARGLYPEREFPGVETLLTLTGYVPEDAIERFHTPLEDRSLRIAYRGRTLPYQYGTLGQEKYSIGVDMRRLARERGVDIDIEVDEDSRIYGDDWYRFMGSARATLASESGSLAADFDGELKVKAAKAMEEGQPFEDFRREHLLELETIAPINVVSPKIFEAIRLRTALICFEGEYSGVIKPDLHYIPLKKDYSNVDEVFAKLEDLDLLRAMTDRAYEDVIAMGAYSYRAFVAQFDKIVAGRALRPWRIEIINAPLAHRPRTSDKARGVPYGEVIEYALNGSVLRRGYQARELADAIDSLYEDVSVFFRRRSLEIYRMHRPKAPPPDAFRFWRIGPDALTITNTALIDGARLILTPEGAQVQTVAQSGRFAATARIDLTQVDLAEEFGWVRVVMRDVEGELRVCLFEADTYRPGPDQVAPCGPGDHEILFALAPGETYTGLVIRSSYHAGEGDPAGSGVFVEAEMLGASRYDTAVQAIVRKLVDEPRGAFRGMAHQDQTQGQGATGPLHLPPADAKPFGSIASDGLFTIDYWRGRGARLEPARNGQRMITPPTAFTYAAGVQLDLGGVSFDTQTCWLKIKLDEVKGAVQAGLSNAEGKVFAFECNIPQMTVPGAVYMKIDAPVGDLLLFRTGPLDQAGEAIFLGVELLVL